MTRLRRNLLANYAGQGWKALMGFVFVPLYIRFLGPESFALIGVHALLYAWLGLLDMGLKPALARDMARYTAGVHDLQFVRDLLKSVLRLTTLFALGVLAGVAAVAPWLAEDWLRASSLPTGQITFALRIMALVLAARFVETVFTNCLVGLQRQVLQNALGMFVATLRGAGALAVLAWVSPTIEAFFAWQAFVGLLSLSLFGIAVHRVLPRPPRPARASWEKIRHLHRFAGGVFLVSAMGLLLTQVDKFVLSRWLPLDQFGLYTLAALVAAGLRMIPSPIVNAVYPSLTRWAATGSDAARVGTLYHAACQLVSVLMGSAALVLIAFAEPVLRLWTGDAMLARSSAPLLSLLATGTLLNGLMWMPYQLQLAHGWTSLAIRTNVVALLVMIPLTLALVHQLGARGAALAWIALNAGYLLVSIGCMHRRLLRGEAVRWYVQDVSLPIAAAALVVAISRGAAPQAMPWLAELAWIGGSAALAVAAAAGSAPAVRARLSARLHGAGVP